FVGQIDNFLGVKTKGADTTTLKIIGYFTETIPSINWSSIACGLIVMAVMLALPKVKLTAKVPAALLGIALSSLVAWLLNWNVALIGKVPATIILDEHFTIDPNRFSQIGELLAPASAIAALGAIESLLAGVVAGRMTGKKLDANQELIAQGVGNMLLPFVGGVPATAAIARISVGVKAGGVTRMVSFIHSATLLASALLLGSLIGQIPLSALSGVLMVTAWRMNEWHLIKFYFKRRLKSPALVLLVTMISTVTFDLTQAILIGIVFSLLLFISQVASLDIVPTDVDWERLRAAGLKVSNELSGIRVVYISGTLFFGAASQFTERLENLSPSSALILSMRGVPVIDASGLHAIENIWHDQLKKGGLLFLTGLQPQVLRMMERAGLVDSIGSDKICWGADQAIIKATELLTEDPSCEWQPGRKVAEKEDETQDELPFGVVKLK
ncbi:SulP family inorganic anion transporter, partial [Candidatus Chlorohelix sp.]|uniref:SulP family inorganic anion transporter n=1 Tax=Candidatus Chlorohelix sp. TaxID=3139201 RepID=UPI0030706AC5